ncbi:MAG: TetR/AcrR family transcriptional regulator [Sphingopyxis granuli]
MELKGKTLARARLALHAADGLAIEGLGTMIRRSDGMMARRRRLLRETRKLLEERGVAGVSVRELAKNANVSPRTIYNIFGSKEQLILLSIRSYYDIFIIPLMSGEEIESLDWVIETAAAVHYRNQQVREYLSALLSIYFSPTVDPAFQNELQNVGAGFISGWIVRVEREGLLLKGITRERAVRDISNLFFSLNHEWLIGAIADDEFVESALKAMLIYLSGITSGRARTEIDNYLRLVVERAEHLSSILSKAEIKSRIDAN